MRMREREIANRPNVEVCGSRDREIVFLYAWMNIRMPLEKIVPFVSQDRKSRGTYAFNRSIGRETAIERERERESESESVGARATATARARLRVRVRGLERK